MTHPTPDARQRRRVKQREVNEFVVRYRHLFLAGLMSMSDALLCVGADKLHCRPCDVCIVSRGEKQSLVEYRP